jgi:hypothetical protein
MTAKKTTEPIEALEPISPELDSIIVIKQLPVIAERLEALAEEIDRRTSEALSLTISEETLKTVKETRTSLRKEYEALEEKRKSVKNAVLDPYEAFEAVYKAVTGKYVTADKQLKQGIEDAEDKIKERKRAEVRKYFDELTADRGIDFINFDVYLPLSAIKANDTPAGLKKITKTYLDKISDELELIKTQQWPDEIMVEYKKLPDFTTALRAVQERHRQLDELELRKRERAEREAAEREVRAKVAAAVVERDGDRPAAPPPPPSFSPPVPEITPDDPVCCVSFKVTGPKSKLRALKQYIIGEGLTIG